MIKNLLGDEPEAAGQTRSAKPAKGAPLSLFDDNADQPAEGVNDFRPPNEPETAGENLRRSGLAWSAGIVFFSSVVFMLIIGWGADLLLGIDPWGKVGGIVLGALIGFIQFFRLTSQIFTK